MKVVKRIGYLSSFMAIIVLLFHLSTNTVKANGIFEDVDGSNHFAQEEILYLYNEGIVSGYQDGTFRPNNTVTRAQAILMMARALDLDLSNRPNPGFSDITSNHSAYEEIAAVVDEGIYPKENKLYPNEPISRESMARMIAFAFELKGESKTVFKDVPKSHWAYPYITKLAANNITVGYDDGTFKPKNKLTRAQFSTFLARALNDDYKTYTYTNQKMRFSINLPNYTKNRLIIKEDVYKDEATGVMVPSVSFYYKDRTYLNEDVFVVDVVEVPTKAWDDYHSHGPTAHLYTQRNGKSYYGDLPGEHPYFSDDVQDIDDLKEAQEWYQLYERLIHALEAMKFY